MLTEIRFGDVGNRLEQLRIRRKDDGSIIIHVEGKAYVGETYSGDMTPVSTVEMSRTEAQSLAAALTAIAL